jgi:hypothetical protein
VTIINLPGCLHCAANPMLLLKLETTNLTGDKQTGDEQTLNPCCGMHDLWHAHGAGWRRGWWMVDAHT